MSFKGENAKPRAVVTPAERLEWQTELDSAMADLDSRLSHPRRRASDTGPQPMLPELGQVEVTNELLDEIAWRVSQQLRRTQPGGAHPADLPAPPHQTPTAAPDPGPFRTEAELGLMPANTVMTIRLRKPLFRWRFWRRARRKHSMISLGDYA